MRHLIYCFCFGLLWFSGLALVIHWRANRIGNPFKRKDTMK